MQTAAGSRHHVLWVPCWNKKITDVVITASLLTSGPIYKSSQVRCRHYLNRNIFYQETASGHRKKPDTLFCSSRPLTKHWWCSRMSTFQSIYAFFLFCESVFSTVVSWLTFRLPSLVHRSMASVNLGTLLGTQRKPLNRYHARDYRPAVQVSQRDPDECRRLHLHIAAIMFLLFAIALLMSLSQQSPTNPPGFDYRILFDRYNTTMCHHQSLEEMIDPIMWNNGVEIEERDCHNFKDGLIFVGFSYIWSAHTGSYLETLAGYGKCEIAVYGQDGCAGEAVGWVNNANTKNQSRVSIKYCNDCPPALC